MGSRGGMRYGQSAAQEAAAGHAAEEARQRDEREQKMAQDAWRDAEAKRMAEEQKAAQAKRTSSSSGFKMTPHVQGLINDQKTTQNMIRTLESKGHTVSSSTHLYKLRQREAYNDRELKKAGYTGQKS